MKPEPEKRVQFLDGWRGAAVLVMLGWHLCWDLASYGCFSRRVMFSPLAGLARMFIVFSFVLLSGISCRYSRDNVRRGIKTLLCALAVSAAMWYIGDPIWFGILHLLGICMCLYGLLGERFEKLPPAATARVCMVLFTVFLVIVDRVRVSFPGMWMFGLRTAAFYSADYYPLFPWMFLFLTGTVVGGKLRAGGGRAFPLPSPGWLRFFGRHALLIYMLHQPVLMGILYLVFGCFPG